jgi:hypothetical protein
MDAAFQAFLHQKVEMFLKGTGFTGCGKRPVFELDARKIFLRA